MELRKKAEASSSYTELNEEKQAQKDNSDDNEQELAELITSVIVEMIAKK